MAKAKLKSKSTVSRGDRSNEMADALIASINKKSDVKIAFKLSDPDAPTHATEFISFGSIGLDISVANRKGGGVPVGKITELSGQEGAGKSLLAASISANTQKQGGIAVYIDTESSATEEFFQAQGVDTTNNFVYLQINRIEEVFGAMDDIIDKIREQDHDVLCSIVVDSVAATASNAEMAADYTKQGYNTDKALVISMAMRKLTEKIARERIAVIFTNQLRHKMNAVPFGKQYDTPGGKAIPFHSSVRIDIKQIGKIKHKLNGVDQVVGAKVRAEVFKNRLGPPHRKCEYDIYFNSGIDDAGSWLKLLKAYKIVKSSGAWYSYTVESTGEIIKFQSKDFQGELDKDEDLKTELYNKLCDKMIMKYDKSKIGVDDVEVEEFDDGGDPKSDGPLVGEVEEGEEE